MAIQDKSAFWKLHDFLFAQQQNLSPETLQDKAFGFLTHETKADTKAVAACTAQKKFAESVHQDEQLAVDLDITGTPSAFLNGQRISVRSVEDLRVALRTSQASTSAVQADSKANVGTN